ncbi:MAG: metal ABC transporter permease [Planctomycetes bacterium]|nr:metal ABC transporter permease [Planctomycetota bacterium]
MPSSRGRTEGLRRILTAMFDYNTRLVTISAGLLGCLAGAVGVYLLLRRKSLIGDTLCHAALPGIALSFLVQVACGGTGKNVLGLLAGAAFSGALGSLVVMLLGRFTRLKPDAILGIVLSVFFGLGMVLFSVVQKIPGYNAAGLENFILGKTASIVESDFWMILGSTAFVLLTLFLLRKELQLFCFDAAFAASKGWPVIALDMTLLTAVLLVVIVGANVVGVILVVALMVIPPSAARFWTQRLSRTIMISSLIGGLAGVTGTFGSLFIDRFPTGPAIVLSATFYFVVSLLFGSEKGFLWRAWSLYRQRYQADTEHVLRAIFELLESRGNAPNVVGQVRSEGVSVSALRSMRSWSPSRLKSSIDTICARGWATRNSVGEIQLTASGIQASVKAVRRHRLLELYFSNLANLSPAALDRGADALEHGLDDDLLATLEKEFIELGGIVDLPASIHPIPASEG